MKAVSGTGPSMPGSRILPETKVYPVASDAGDAGVPAAYSRALSGFEVHHQSWYNGPSTMS